MAPRAAHLITVKADDATNAAGDHEASAADLSKKNNNKNEEITTPTNTPSSGSSGGSVVAASAAAATARDHGHKIPLFKGLKEHGNKTADRSGAGTDAELDQEDPSLAERGPQAAGQEGADNPEEQGVAEVGQQQQQQQQQHHPHHHHHHHRHHPEGGKEEAG